MNKQDSISEEINPRSSSPKTMNIKNEKSQKGTVDNDVTTRSKNRSSWWNTLGRSTLSK